MIRKNLVPIGSESAGERWPKGKKEIKSVCRMDHGGCGVIVTIEDGRISNIAGDRNNPNNRGYLCVKGRAAAHLVYHPDRLKCPLKRVGERGSRLWEPISWDEAFSIITAKLVQLKKDYGAECVAISQGTGRGYMHILFRFASAFGTPNVTTTSHMCHQPKLKLGTIMLGGLPIADFDGGPKCILLWANNVPFTNSDGMCGDKFIRAYKREGVKLIVVDPKRISLASQADLWLQIRPGTDAALALGMLNVIIKEKLYDNDFVAKWTFGFPELVERVKEYTPEKVSQITWVPADLIVKAARMYATTKPACIQFGVPIEQCENSSDNLKGLFCLMAITGNLDVPGGNVFWVTPGNMKWPIEDPSYTLRGLLSEQQAKKAIGSERYPIYCGVDFGSTVRASPPLLWKTMVAGKPYPIKALLIIGHNPLLSLENSKYIRKGFDNLEFVVVVDLFMTPSAEFADIILPAASWLEIDSLSGSVVRWGIFARQKVTRMWQCKSDFEILNELGNRLGMQEYFWPDTESHLNFILKQIDMTWEEFKKVGYITGDMRYRKYEKEGFNTPSGKVELYSTILEKYGYDPLPAYREPTEGFADEEYAREFPLMATTARSPFFFHTEHRQLNPLRKAHLEPQVEIHPETARKHGIHEGDEIWIESKRGKIIQKAKLTDRIHPQVIYVDYGWWFPESTEPGFSWDKSNINILTDNDPPLDPVFSSTRLRPFRCRIYKKEN